MKDDKVKPKKTFIRPELKDGMSAEEEARAINRMSEAMVDAIFGKDFGAGAKEKMRKKAREGKKEDRA
jgi:hypothetical protein